MQNFEGKTAVITGAASGIGLAFSRTPTTLFLFRALSGGAATAWVTISVLYNSHFTIEHAVRTAGQLNLLSAIGQDPAQSSSIILTTVTDVVGFFAFLGLAVVVLL